MAGVAEVVREDPFSQIDRICAITTNNLDQRQTLVERHVHGKNDRQTEQEVPAWLRVSLGITKILDLVAVQAP